MDKIGAYSAYQKSYAENVKHLKKEDVTKAESTDKAKEVNKTSEKEKVTLSDRAKELLKELQKKYQTLFTITILSCLSGLLIIQKI